MDRADETARETYNAASNSYGAGYDRGLYDGLQRIFAMLPKAAADAVLSDD